MNETIPVNNEEQRDTLKIGTALFGEPEYVGGLVDLVVNVNRRVILKMEPPMFVKPE